MLYIWIAVLVAAVVVEALTNDFVAIWFFPAAVVSMVLALLNTSPWVQLLVFLVLGLVLVVATRPLCRKFLTTKQEKTNVESVIGSMGYVTEDVDNISAAGQVKLGGMYWTARSEDGHRIPAGTLVEVTKIEGVKAFVKPVPVEAEEEVEV